MADLNMNTDISIIITTKNEEKTIQTLLKSIDAQTLTPEEVIIVDSLSDDKTPDLIQEYMVNSSLNITFISEELNRSQARNMAIRQARSKHIAVTDAGVKLKSDWLELLNSKLNSGYDAVAGAYQTKTQTKLNQAMALWLGLTPDEFHKNPDYLPSSRSIAFSKTAWEKVGGYPDHLNYCEDLVFAQNLKKHTKMTTEPKALVEWEVSENLWQFSQKLRHYAQGDVLALYRPHLQKIITIPIRYIIFFVWQPIFLLYLGWSYLKLYFKSKNHQVAWYGPILQLISDLSVTLGAVQASIQLISAKRQPKSG